MNYTIEYFEQQYTCYCDKHPKGACHSDFYDTPQKALQAFIEIDLPDYEDFLKRDG